MSKNIKVYFSKTKDYKIIPATGVWGGISPSGDIAFDLFIDKTNSPEYIELKVNSDNKTEEVKRGEEKLVRESQIGIILRPGVAYTIGEWLIKKAEAAGFTKSNKKKK